MTGWTQGLSVPLLRHSLEAAAICMTALLTLRILGLG